MVTAMREWFRQEVQMMVQTLEHRLEEKLERVEMKMATECRRLSEQVCLLEEKIPRAYSDSTSTSSIQVCGSTESLQINVTMPTAQRGRSQSESTYPYQRRPSTSPMYLSLDSLKEEVRYQLL